MTPELEAAARAIAAAYNRAVEATTPSGFFAGIATQVSNSLAGVDTADWLKSCRDQWNAWRAKAELAQTPAEINVLISQAEILIGSINYIAGETSRVSLKRAALETISDDPNVNTFGDALATVPGQVVKKVEDILPEGTGMFVLAILASLFAGLILVAVIRK